MQRQGNMDLTAIKWIYSFVTQRNAFTQMSEDNVQHKVMLERQNSWFKYWFVRIITPRLRS